MKTLQPYQYIPRAAMMIDESMMVLAMMQLALDWATHPFINEPLPTIMAYSPIYIKNVQASYYSSFLDHLTSQFANRGYILRLNIPPFGSINW